VAEAVDHEAVKRLCFEARRGNWNDQTFGTRTPRIASITPNA
jgi:hypothetical protein